MSKLKLGPIEDDKPVKLTIALGRQSGQPAVEPTRLIAPMILRFIATDPGFAKVRKAMETAAPSTKE